MPSWIRNEALYATFGLLPLFAMILFCTVVRHSLPKFLVNWWCHNKFFLIFFHFLVSACFAAHPVTV